VFYTNVRFSSPLIEGRLVRRYQRFFADVRLADGALVTAHCANPGSMKSCLVEHGRVWLSQSDNPARKLRFTWEIAEVRTARIFVNPLAANRLVREAIEGGVVRELAGYTTLKSETRFGSNTRFDFLLERDGERCYVEVKNMTLGLGAGRAAFPDSVTTRGQKHLAELIQAKRTGHRAVLLFCVARSDARSAEAAADIDPRYGAWLRRAHDAGVEIMAYKCRITQRGVWLTQALSVVHGSKNMEQGTGNTNEE
jgi:sugar fermentation stimulation protein A